MSTLNIKKHLPSFEFIIIHSEAAKKCKNLSKSQVIYSESFYDCTDCIFLECEERFHGLQTLSYFIYIIIDTKAFYSGEWNQQKRHKSFEKNQILSVSIR